MGINSIFKYEEFPSNDRDGVVGCVASIGLPASVRRPRMRFGWIDGFFGWGFSGRFGFAWNPWTTSRCRSSSSL